MKSGIDRVFGTNGIDRTVFAVPSRESLDFWEERLKQADIFNCEIEAYGDSHILRFEDFDGIQLGLTPAKEISHDVFSRQTADIAHEHAIMGIDSIHLRVRYPQATANLLNEFFGLEVIRQESPATTVLSKPNALFQQEIHLIEDKKSPLEEMGIGGTHHIALAVKDKQELEQILEKVTERNYLNSGIKNREFFHSLYFRDPNNILIEVATEESTLDKPVYQLSDDFSELALYLPSFLERMRESIESRLDRPF